MAATPADKLLLLGLFGDIASFSLIVAATASPAWLFFPIGSTYTITGQKGLFKFCVENVCADIKPSSDEKTVQALSILGIVLCGIAVLLALVFLYKASKQKPESKVLPYMSGMLSAIGGLASFIGAILYAVNVYSIDSLGINNYLYSYLGYSFSLSMTGSIILLTTGSFVMAGGNRMVANRQARNGVVISSGPVVNQTLMTGWTQNSNPQCQPPVYSTGFNDANPAYSSLGYAPQQVLAPPPYSEAVAQKY